MINILLATVISLSGADHIELGEEHMKQGKWKEAILSFKEAISSDLGPPANATCYWNMYISYDQLKDDDGAADSIFMFRGTVLLFKDFLDEAPLGHPGLIWFKRAGIQEKMIYSKSILDIYWMRKNSYYCRREMYSCSIPFAKMVGLYANKLPFCKDKEVVNIRVPKELPNVLINIDCSDGSVEEYYFTIQNENERVL